MPTTITANGSSAAVYLDMSGSTVRYSIGTLTAPVTWNNLLNTAAWPVTITNSAPAASTILNVVFMNNLTISSSYGDTSGYFIMGSSYITFNGADYRMTISSITNYPGLIRNGTSSVNGYANIIVQNIISAPNASSTLSSGGGWICQSSFGRGVSDNNIVSCRNPGTIGIIASYGGGIAGDYVGRFGGSITFRSCTNNQAIDGSAGGIAGAYAGNGGSATFIECSNSGTIASNAGGICGNNSASVAGSLVTFTECSNSGTIANFGGGICASYVARNSGIVRFTNCINASNVTIADDAGGFAGTMIASNGGSVTFTGCINNAPVNGTDAGGFVGSNAGRNIGNLTFTNCINNGNIGSYRSGGFAGAFAARDQGTITITNCTNNGLLNGGGGFIGYYSGYGISPFTNSSITITNSTNNGEIREGGGLVSSTIFGNLTCTNCVNTGAITGTGTGGIVGMGAGLTTTAGNGTLTFTNCINTGAITGTNAGGIAGNSCANDRSSVSASFINCANTGIISAGRAGGIVGSFAGNVTLTRCYSTGTISGSESGGIVSFAFGSTAYANGAAGITSCYSTGAITGASAGGIASGFVGSDAPYNVGITNCYSLGNITAGNGGIVYGCRPSNKVTISNCYSFGTVGTAGSGIVASGQTQPLSLVNCYVANNSWSDATANASLTGYPTGTGITTGQATTWTSISANIPYLLSTFFSLAGNTTAQQIYTPDSMIITLNESSAPGYYQPGVYSIANTSQLGNTLTTKVYVLGGTTPKYLGYGYTTYSLTNANGSSSKPIAVTINATTGVLSFVLPFPCFLEGTKILCFENNKEVYRPVESLRKGDLVKTIYNGYLPIHKIGTSPMYNPSTDDRISDRLYKCSKENYPALFEDLYITGCHSILVPSLTYMQGLITKASLGKLYVTDKHCRLMAWVDEKAEPYTREGIYNIYHIALENDDYYMNYGIYANGLLVESCSKRYLTEMSNMRLLGEEDNSVTEDESSPPESIFPKMANLVEIC